jgi:hypothetical protein
LTEREGEKSLLNEKFTGNSWDSGFTIRNLPFLAWELDWPHTGAEEKGGTSPETGGDAAKKRTGLFLLCKRKGKTDNPQARNASGMGGTERVWGSKEEDIHRRVVLATSVIRPGLRSKTN